MHAWLEKMWYGNHWVAWLIWPISLVYQAIIYLRRHVLTRFYQCQFSPPVVVVGNITVGGVGKTPFVLALIREAQRRGVKVGVVSRGYGASIQNFPHEVNVDQDTAELVGDEPLMIARNAACPVVIAPKRNAAVQYLLANHACQLIISDDGLQHYRMGRAIEIAVVDGSRPFGNGLCLPAGPLREPTRRLNEVDFVIVNGKDNRNKNGKANGLLSKAYAMHLVLKACQSVHNNKPIDWSALPRPIAAIAGIGNPERFFESLRALGLEFTPYAFPDHYSFRENNLDLKEKSIVMTEKDAVKCQAFAKDNYFVLPVEAQLDPAFWQAFWSHEQLKGLLS
jgi:tetraacyldisaccharide 4'-kinase